VTTPKRPKRLKNDNLAHALTTEERRRVLPANEQQALERGLTGLHWAEDTEALERRWQERHAARYVWS
jgi:hypothetical protein